MVSPLKMIHVNQDRTKYPEATTYQYKEDHLDKELLPKVDNQEKTHHQDFNKENLLQPHNKTKDLEEQKFLYLKVKHKRNEN